MRRTRLTLALAAIMPLCFTLLVQAAETAPQKPAEKATLAVFRINGAVTELPQDDSFPFSAPVGPSLKDLVTRIKKAADDSAVKAVVMLFDGGSVGQAQTEELRQAMAAVRSAGKEVYVHSDSLSMGDYVLLSGASRLSVVPTADLWVTGLNGEAPYIRGLLDKLGVKPDFLTCGEYKSAAEMFMLKEPSPASDKMQNWLLDGIFETYIKLIADGRGVQRSKAREWIDNGPYIAEKAMAAGMIDAIEHRQEFTALLKEKFGDNAIFEKQYGKTKPPQLDFSSPFAMFQIWGDLLSQAKKKKATKDGVAIVYVEGGIALGSGVASPFGEVAAMSSDIRKALDEAAADDTIKAVVLRVNSPGGSAVASEIILDATRRVKAKKPFVVSMGDVAGSGGYYVACASDVIFADEATITGSIGVVGGKLATTEMWEKAGITFKAYQRGKNAGLLSSADIFSADERTKMQSWMDDIYGVFKGHVTKIRGDRLKKPIDELAGGRVYTGRQALELGLVDKIGTLQDAISHVALEAKLKEYDVRVVPRPKNFLEVLLEDSAGGDGDSSRVSLTGRFPLAAGPTSLVDLAMPYLRHLDPQRVSTVVTALQQLELVQREGVTLTMPPVRIGR